ncbi:MAG TPA: Gfo/Idh/MocA family oxidoreductase [Bacillales bacterium]|nr:Gfo/Idh/MocA family oxidoreductase [Bacillales bacterium]
MVKVAVIGSGAAVEAHLEAWSRIDRAVVTGVSGKDANGLREVSDRGGVACFDSLSDLLAQADVDVVDVCGPGLWFREPIRQAVRAGKSVICEGPLSANVKDTNELIDLCEQHGVQVYTGHLLRFSPEYVDAHQQVENGAIGKPGVFRLSRSMPNPGESSLSVGNQDLFLTVGAGEWDWLRWTLGEVKRVMARRVKHSSVEYALTTLRMEDGTVVHVELSRSECVSESSFELAGDQGMISHNSNESTPVRLKTSQESSVGLVQTEDLLVKSPLQRWLEHVANCLSGGEKSIGSTEDARKAVEIAEAVIQSAEAGKPVSIGGKGEAK